jgi:O-glycosyl hydrolase
LWWALTKIEQNYPGTKLAITEYYYGGGADISGALAEADVLGVFGREGVFAAALWHVGQTDDRFIHAAFDMYRNCDGKGHGFGDTGLAARTTDVERTSVYASLDAQRRIVLVAINKSSQAVPMQVRLGNCPQVARAAVYRLTQATPRPVRGDNPPAIQAGRLDCELPARSVSTLVLSPQ